MFNSCGDSKITFDPIKRNAVSNMIFYHYLYFYVGIAISGMSGFFCMTKALKMVDPTLVAFLRSLEIVFGFIFQVAVMKQIPTFLSKDVLNMFFRDIYLIL